MTSAQSQSSPKVPPEPTQRIIANPDKTRLTYAVAVLIGLLIAIVWGYFSDLTNGQVGWFIGRVVFVTLFQVWVIWLVLRLSRASGPA